MLTVQEAASTTFAPALFGYRRDEVDALRSRLESALAESERGLTRGLMTGADELEAATFSTAPRGYRRDDVDAFFHRGAETLAGRGVTRGSGHRRITPEEVRQVHFGREVDGYKPAAVRRFLARAASALDAHHAGRDALLLRADVEATDFPLRFWGWRCEEVERVCDRVASTLVFYEARGPVEAPANDDEDEVEPEV
ncbi:MAG: DivIVA domain-containing protein [Acidimicrobiia bacterium]|nr:DivIVA domain-containing protein [Acidimicrobiia bacterium]